MKLKPFVNVSFCYKCGYPVPRAGLSLRTSYGNASISSPFVCPNCKRKNQASKSISKNTKGR